MAKPATNKKLNAKPTAQASLRGGPNWPLFVLALLGMAVSAYLTYSSWQGKLVAGCTVGSGCDVVLSSRWSTLFGMPTSFRGFLTYALLAAIAWNKRAAQQWKWAWVVSLFGLLYSLYLTSISLFVLQGLSLLPHVGWFDDSDLYHRHVSTAGQVTGILLGAVAREGRWWRAGGHSHASSSLCGLFGKSRRA